MNRPADDHWTPSLVEAAMVEALQWLRRTPQHHGPAGFVTVVMPFRPTIEDHLFEGWGLPEPPDEDAPQRRVATRSEIARHEAAMDWPRRILVANGRRTEARALNLWLASRVGAGSFRQLCQERGFGRAAATAARDRGLSLISVRLDREGVPPWRAA